MPTSFIQRLILPSVFFLFFFGCGVALALPSLSAWIGTLIVFWVGIAWLLRSLTPTERRMAAVWGGCAVLTAASGLVIARANTLFVPISFFSLFVAVVLIGAARRSRPAVILSTVLLTGFLITSALQHRATQRSLSANSSQYVIENARYLWGIWSPALPYIPEARVDVLRDQLAAYGIFTKADYDSQLPRLIAEGVIDASHDDWLSGW
ncbi:MAG: hypothetical protein SGJ24_16390 [Chloroflexota bacterium]|nr:hypothetical protein [Chloroflexota bacterium]